MLTAAILSVFFVPHFCFPKTLFWGGPEEMLLLFLLGACQPQTARQTAAAEVALCTQTLPLAATSSLDGLPPPDPAKRAGKQPFTDYHPQRRSAAVV